MDSLDGHWMGKRERRNKVKAYKKLAKLSLIGFLLPFIMACPGDGGTNLGKSCAASITMHLILGQDSYGIDATISNTGDRTLLAFTVPFTVFFVGGTTDSREAFTPTSLSPGMTDRIRMLITPPDQNPVNPRYIGTNGKTVDRAEYGQYDVRCLQS